MCYRHLRRSAFGKNRCQSRRDHSHNRDLTRRNRFSPFAARENRLTHIISASRVLASDGFAVDYFGRADMPSPASPQTLLALLDIELPIVQAPMAGVSSPAMAAAVGNAGALGSIGVGATNVAGSGPRQVALGVTANPSAEWICLTLVSR
jgi:hypothetical protein